MNKPLVSIITTCYNGEKYIGRFLESILTQSYQNIELIVADNASIDNTMEIMESYVEIFKNKGITYCCIRVDENVGPASGINAALKYVAGDYLTWPDSDDILYYNCIEQKVEYLENNMDCGIVFCQGQVVDDITSKHLGILSRKTKLDKENIFHDLVIGRNIYFTPGCYMLRMSSFLELNPHKDIYMYNNLTGQNHQMLLPIAYSNTCGHIKKPLFDYAYRDDSISREHALDKNCIPKTYADENVIVNTLDSFYMSDVDKAHYLEAIKKKYIRKRLFYAYKTQDVNMANIEYTQLKELNDIKCVDRVMYHGTSNSIVRSINELYKLLLYKISRIPKKLKKIRDGKK